MNAVPSPISRHAAARHTAARHTPPGGLAAATALFRRYGGGNSYQGFAAQQMDYVLGANPCGSSFVTGKFTGQVVDLIMAAIER